MKEITQNQKERTQQTIHHPRMSFKSTNTKTNFRVIKIMSLLWYSPHTIHESVKKEVFQILSEWQHQIEVYVFSLEFVLIVIINKID